MLEQSRLDSADNINFNEELPVFGKQLSKNLDNLDHSALVEDAVSDKDSFEDLPETEKKVPNASQSTSPINNLATTDESYKSK